MSKADVIEVEGKVVEKLPNAMFRVKFGKRRTYCAGYDFRQNAYEFHPHPARG